MDDIIILSDSSKEMQQIIEYLENTFEMVSMGEPKKYLGMEIERDPEKQIIQLHQTQYIRKIFKKFLMHECNPCRTPMVATAMQQNNEIPLTEQENKLKNVQFREKIGSLFTWQIVQGQTLPFLPTGRVENN